VVIFKHTKIIGNDHFIFFYGIASHSKATQKVSHFYHASIFSYEINKDQRNYSFSEKQKQFSIAENPFLLTPPLRTLTDNQGRGQTDPARL
jgi:hypothetical protein